MRPTQNSERLNRRRHHRHIQQEQSNSAKYQRRRDPRLIRSRQSRLLEPQYHEPENGKEVECPGGDDGEVDERTEAAAEEDEEGGEAGLEEHGV